MQHHATCKYMQRPSANGECRSRSCSPGYPLPSMDNFRECRRSQESRSCKERRCHRSRRSPPLPCSRSFAPERCSEEKNPYHQGNFQALWAVGTPTFREMQTVLQESLFLLKLPNSNRGLEILVLDAGEVAIPGPSALLRNDLPCHPS